MSDISVGDSVRTDTGRVGIVTAIEQWKQPTELKARVVFSGCQFACWYSLSWLREIGTTHNGEVRL